VQGSVLLWLRMWPQSHTTAADRRNAGEC